MLYLDQAERDTAQFLPLVSQLLARRGPDSAGKYQSDRISLVHRRLSIIDLSERGRQPMSNEDGTVLLIFNGEIYNYRELRTILQSKHEFRSESDSEVLIHLYEEFADRLDNYVDGVRGMFAFALWDTKRARLILARDRLGIKPLVYYRDADSIAFASDLTALTAFPHIPRRLDWTSIYEYLLFQTIPGPHTIYRDILHVRPGTMLIAEDASVRELKYWKPGSSKVTCFKTEADAQDAVESALLDSVRAHMVSDVKVGSFLSGGIDSGLVTAMAASESPETIDSFSATFPGAAVDEGKAALDTSRRIGSHHREFAVTHGFLDDLEKVVDAMDEPMALTSAVSLYHLSRMAREHVKVVLTGDGGDELFAGYNRHRPYPIHPAISWIPWRRRAAVGVAAGKVLASIPRRYSSPVSKLEGLSRSISRGEAELYVPRLYSMSPEMAFNLMCAEGRMSVDAERHMNRVREVFSDCPAEDQVSRMLYVDLQTTLADEMLRKVDRMTMAHGLEARVPFLDHPLVELALAIPVSMKKNANLGKLVLRSIAKGWLGPEAAARPKSGFNSPLNQWDVRTRETDKCVDVQFRMESPLFNKVALKGEGSADLSNSTWFQLFLLSLWVKKNNVLSA